MISLRRARPRGRTRRRRFRFSLNGLAIQLSALALSFTLVALLVVTGSHSAFVQQNESVAKAQALAKARALERLRHQRAGVSAGTSPAARPSAPAVPAAVTEPIAPPPAPAPIVELTDSAAGTAMFGGETLTPGNPVERCIDVSYVGDAVPGPVVLYAAPTSGDLAPFLDLTVDIGNADTGVPGTCDGFQPTAHLFRGTLAAFADAHPSFAAGQVAWDPSDTATTRRFRFSLVVLDDPAASGRTAGFGFSWRTEVP